MKIYFYPLTKNLKTDNQHESHKKLHAMESEIWFFHSISLSYWLLLFVFAVDKIKKFHRFFINFATHWILKNFLIFKSFSRNSDKFSEFKSKADNFYVIIWMIKTFLNDKWKSLEESKKLTKISSLAFLAKKNIPLAKFFPLNNLL